MSVWFFRMTQGLLTTYYQEIGATGGCQSAQLSLALVHQNTVYLMFCPVIYR